jgi:DnaJ-domain-containing protein 1
MTVALAILSGLLLVGLAIAAFLRMDAARVAGTLRLSGPIALAVVGGGLTLVGRAGLGGMLLSLALAWYAANRKRRGTLKSPGRRSTVRTATLEMELDHDSGQLEGLVLAGRHEGRALGTLSEAELTAMLKELAADAESRQLLETYLDGRFPAWREHAKADDGHRQRVAPGSGAMTKEEAYQVLGLETGASAAQVRKAHRSLMQRLHPDVGGSSFLAARINEAKDILLSDHD